MYLLKVKGYKYNSLEEISWKQLLVNCQNTFEPTVVLSLYPEGAPEQGWCYCHHLLHFYVRIPLA